MKQFLKNTLEIARLLFIILIGTCSSLLLVAEADTLTWVILSKVFAVIGFIVCYLLYKSVIH